MASIGLASAFACTSAAPLTPERTQADPEPSPQAVGTDVQILSATKGDGLTLRRTLCYGNCPAYQVTLRQDGTVEWWGFGMVARTGPARDVLAVGEVTRLMEEFERLVATQRADEAKASGPRSRRQVIGCTDTPTTTITLTRGQTQATISVDHCVETTSAPLSRVADLIDAAARTQRWINDDACKPTLSSAVPDACFGPDADRREDCAMFIPPLMAALRTNADAHVRLWTAAGAPSARERVERAHEALVGREIADARIHLYLFPPFAEDPDGWDDGSVTVELGSASCVQIDR